MHSALHVPSITGAALILGGWKQGACRIVTFKNTRCVAHITSDLSAIILYFQVLNQLGLPSVACLLNQLLNPDLNVRI